MIVTLKRKEHNKSLFRGKELNILERLNKMTFKASQRLIGDLSSAVSGQLTNDSGLKIWKEGNVNPCLFSTVATFVILVALPLIRHTDKTQKYPIYHLLESVLE